MTPTPLYDDNAAAYKARAQFESHLGAELVRSLAGNPSRLAMVDRSGPKRRPIRSGTLLAIASLLAEEFKKIPERRVGIVLPPGVGGSLANCALTLVDKIPVNLNFTAGKAAIESCIEQSGIKTIISADIMKEKLPEFPWSGAFVDIGTLVKNFGKRRILSRIALVHLSSPERLIKKWNVPTQGGDREASLLFTSGSSGEPKGVPLSHRNILGNIQQIVEFKLFIEGESALGCLPLFHSFGFTVTLWLPLIGQFLVITTPSPFDLSRNIQAIREENINILIGAPTFLRPYIKRAEPHSIPSVRCVVSGAEKTPAGFGELWESHFGNHYLEGYGLTETTPVMGVNLPPRDGLVFGQWNRRGSIGRLLPGQAIRIVDPDTGEDLGYDQQGLLHVKGVNVFNGYLDNPKETAEVLKDGWLNTGDLARLDKDHFLYIDGRLSRFSKIGGEKVPHGTIESAILKVLGMKEGDTEKPLFVVAGRRDKVKGESLVLLSTIDIDMHHLRDCLHKEQGLPNLWAPRVLKRIDAVPLLASGKFDLRAIQKLAAED